MDVYLHLTSCNYWFAQQQLGTIIDVSRLYGVSSVVDVHKDMQLYIDMHLSCLYVNFKLEIWYLLPDQTIYDIDN